MEMTPAPTPGPTGVGAPRVRFLHTADWQIGMTRHFLDADAQARFTAARVDAIARIGEIARAEGCAFVVVGGDVFETNQVERRVVVRALEAMAATEVDVYLLPGNHDPLDASSVLRSSTFREHAPANVHVLAEPGAHPVAPGVELVAAPWTTKRPLSDLCADAVAGLEPDGTVRIVVGHGAVDVLSPDPTEPALVRVGDAESALHAGAIHYVALGDRHSTTSVGATGRIWYSGAPEPTAYDEVDPGQVLVVDLDGATGAVEVLRRRVGTWRFVRHEAHLDGLEDVESLARWLDGLADKDRTIVKLSLVGTLSLAAASRLEAVLAHHADLLAALERWERHTDLVVLPDQADLDELQLGGFAREALADIRAMATDGGADAQTARDALGLLYRLGRAS